MPFPWCHPSVSQAFRRDQARKAEAMYVRELEERAALLCRLRFGRAQAAARLRANLRWELGHRGEPKLVQKVDAIVDAVYARGGRASGPPEP
jgi:hypothetical protein